MKYPDYDEFLESKLIEQGEFSKFVRSIGEISVEDIANVMNVDSSYIDEFEDGLVNDGKFSKDYFDVIAGLLKQKNTRITDFLDDFE